MSSCLKRSSAYTQEVWIGELLEALALSNASEAICGKVASDDTHVNNGEYDMVAVTTFASWWNMYYQRHLGEKRERHSHKLSDIRIMITA